MKSTLKLILIALFLVSCANEQSKTVLSNADQVDQAHLKVVEAVLNDRTIVTLDHRRMAEKAGAKTPPAIATIFTDDSPIVSELIKANQEVAMDLPFRLLAFEEPLNKQIELAYTNGDYLANRHGLSMEQVQKYTDYIDGIVDNLPSEMVNDFDYSGLDLGMGIIKISSDYSFEESLGRVRMLVHVNQDARLFAEIDFQKDAKNFDVQLNPTYMVMFGAPKPGAMAMHDAPRIGLDAFCQKVLIYQDDQGAVFVCFSDMAAFGDFYYGKHNKGQEVVTQRMKQGLTKLLTKK